MGSKAALIVYLCCLCLTCANGEALGSLQVLTEFSLPYQSVSSDYGAPVMSMSQQFSDLGTETWVETAVPLEVPDDLQWDLRAMRFDVAIGRRVAGETGRFSFDWDGERVLRRFGGRLHIYASCPSATHRAGKPCPNPLAIFNARLVDESLEKATQGDWGVVYKADVFLSRDPATKGYVANDRIWVSFFATMPSRYTDDMDGKEYELRHWFPVASSASEDSDLAIADHADLLERGWTDWRHGQELSNSLYQGVSYPSPGFSAVGYATEPAANPPPSPSRTPNNTHHWPSGIPPVSRGAPPDNGQLSGVGLALVISVSAGLGLLLLIVGFLAINGLIRRRRRNLSAKNRHKEMLRWVGDEQSQLMLGEDGSFAAASNLRHGTENSAGAPMLIDDDDEGDQNNPYKSNQRIRGALSSYDDDSDDFEEAQ